MTDSIPHHKRTAEAMAAELPTTGAPPRGLSMAKQMKLKQQKFCECYVHHGNAARAAREAGYSEKNASHQGGQLLRNTKVRAYIHELRQKFALQTVWEMEDAFDKLEIIYDGAMTTQNYHAAVRAVEAQTRIKMQAICQLNAVATRTLDGAPVPEGGILKLETDNIRRYSRPHPNRGGIMQDMSPETFIGPSNEKYR